MTLNGTDYERAAIEIMRAAHRAGAAIMRIYRSAPRVEYKADRSPVTDADRAAEEILIAALSELMPDVPVIAEERTAAGFVPQTGSTFFLVDPLDGTKEFLKFNGEFTVNVALIEDSRPVFGLIYAPDRGDCFVTLNRGKAFRCRLAVEQDVPKDLAFTPLNGESAAARPFTAIISRSHPRPEALSFMESLGNPPRETAGSSLKFGLLASGEADVYPRFGPTSEWDIAAGQAILEAAGGAVVDLSGEPLRYGNREGGFINPPFIAWRRLPGEKPS